MPIADLATSTFYLNKDQTHKGRSILAFNDHKRELFELSLIERERFMEDLAKAAKALQNTFYPSKLNYAIYGDLVSHLHFHIVPKYEDGEEWGGAFVNAPQNKKRLSEAEYDQRIQEIQNQL